MLTKTLDCISKFHSPWGSCLVRGSTTAASIPRCQGVRLLRQRRVRCLLFAAVVLAISTSAAAAANSSLSLVKDGQPACSIVVPQEADEWTRKAAQWLQEYVHKVSGAELRILSEDQAPTGTLISVGHTKLAKKAGIDVSDLKWDGCKLVVKENVLYLIGRDSKEIKDNPTVGAKGTCRAVLTFLEDFCGVRWFLPTPQGELIPKLRDVAVPPDLAKTFIPAFAYSDGRSTYNEGFLPAPGGTPASIANNFRCGIAFGFGGGTHHVVVPAETYFKDHPEYFALIKGKRTAEGNHLCTSNPAVKQLLVDWIRAKFDEGYDLVGIGAEDGFRRCECPECEKLDDYRYESTGLGWDDFMYGALRKTPAERLFLLHKAVIDEVLKSHPDKQVLLQCYAPTAWPSKKIDKWPDNVVGELMNQGPKFIEAWNGKVNGFTGYVYWFNMQTPLGIDVHASPAEVAHQVRYFRDNKFIGLYQFADAGWGFQGPLFYELGKLMGDPDRDYRALIEEYCRGVYGKGGESMLQFFNMLYARHEEILPPMDQRTDKIPKDLTTDELYVRLYPPAFLNRLEQLLRQAESESDTEQAKGWVRLTRDQFDFTKLLTEAVISYRAYQSDRTEQNWADLKKRVDDFDAYRMKIITYRKEYTDNWFPGYDHFCNYLTADVQHESKVYYIAWEKRKEEVLKKGIKGVGIGYGGGFGYSYIKEPLTLDFSKPSG